MQGVARNDVKGGFGAESNHAIGEGRGGEFREQEPKGDAHLHRDLIHRVH
jgi:hypothetical protein